MDIAEVKDLVKCLIAAADGGCSIQDLLIDFEQETGFELPLFNFYNPRQFLLTLTDIIKVVKTTAGEWVVLVDPNNVNNDANAYIARQNGPPRNAGERPDFSTRNTRFENEIERCDINSFIRAYQTGWVTLNEYGDWERVNSINRIPPPDDMKVIEDVDFLFKEDELDGFEDITKRRTAVKLFLRSIGSVRDPERPVGGMELMYPLPYTTASEETKKFLQNIMPEDGIWLNELPALYYNTYGSVLDCRDHGYRTLLEMVKSLKDIFRCMKPFKGEVFLFNASRAPSFDEEQMYDRAFYELSEDVIWFILNFLENYCEVTSEPGIIKDDFLALYYKKYRFKLDYRKYGFPDFKTMLSRLNGKILKIEDFGRNVIIRPLVERSNLGKRTIFSLTPDDDDVFSELFPISCIDFRMKYLEMKPQCYFKLGRRVKVNISYFISPGRFYIQLKIFEKELLTLMKDMYHFYKFKEKEYRMPEATIRPNQICAALYRYDGYDEWHRSIILSVPDERHVVVFLVDYGMKLKLDKERVRFLHRKFYHLPKQGFFVRIHNIKPFDRGPWPLNVTFRFLDLISSSDVLFRALRYDFAAERLLGELFFYENNRQKSVGLRLYREGLVARRLDDREPFPSSDDDDDDHPDNHDNRDNHGSHSHDNRGYHDNHDNHDGGNNGDNNDDDNRDNDGEEENEDEEEVDDEGEEEEEEENNDGEDDDENYGEDDDDDDGDDDGYGGGAGGGGGDAGGGGGGGGDGNDNDDDDGYYSPYISRLQDGRLILSSRSLVPVQRNLDQPRNSEPLDNASGRVEAHNENREQHNAAFWDEVLSEFRGVNSRSEDRERRLRDEWTLEKEVSALAFYLLNTAHWLQEIAQNDIENGLIVAQTLAEKIIELE